MTRFWARATLAAWLLALAAVVAPLALGLGGAPSPHSAGLDPSRLARLAGNSLLMSGLAVVFALLAGVPVAITAARLAGPRERTALLACACAPLFVAPAVLAVAAVWIFGGAGWLTGLVSTATDVFPVAEQLNGPQNLTPAPIYTFPGGGFVLAWGFAPLLILTLTIAMRRVDGEAEQAALLETGPLGVLARVSLPLAGGGLAAGCALVFLFAMTEFSVPESLRSLPVLVAEVYVQFGVFYDTRPALGAALVLVGICAVALAGAAWWMRRHEGSHEAESAREAPPLPRSPATLALRAAGWVCAVTPGALLLGTLAASANGPDGRWATIRNTWSIAHRELWFTAGWGIAAALLAMVLGMVLGFALAGLRRPNVARLLVAAPLIIPGPVFGVGVQVLLSRPPGSLPLGLDDALAALADTMVPLVVIWAVRVAAVVALPFERLVRAVPPATLESAALDGAGPLARAWHFLLPAAWPAAAAGGLAAFALTLGEAGAAVLLLPPGPTTLGVRILTQMHYAPIGQVSVLCLMALLPGLLAYGAGVAVVLVAARRRVGLAGAQAAGAG